MTTQEKLENFYSKKSPWKQSIQLLRELLFTTDLSETWKWSFPTYTLNDKNVVAVVCFKHHYGLWFFQGALLKDNLKLLKNAQEGKTKAMRQLKYTSVNDLDLDVVKLYLNEAIQNSRDKKQVSISKTIQTVTIPVLLQNEMYNDPSLQNSFDALTAYKQKEYCIYINEAKRDTAKQRRLEKSISLILNGKGLNDKYR